MRRTLSPEVAALLVRNHELGTERSETQFCLSQDLNVPLVDLRTQVQTAPTLLRIFSHKATPDSSIPSLLLQGHTADGFYSLHRDDKQTVVQLRSSALCHQGSQHSAVGALVVSKFRLHSAIGLGQSIVDRYNGELPRYFLSDKDAVMLYPRTNAKSSVDCAKSMREMQHYGAFLFDLAVSLAPADTRITVHGTKDYKLNHYSLDPEQLHDSWLHARRQSQHLTMDEVDHEASTLHTDIEPPFCFVGRHHHLALTFALVRGLDGYEPSMGKTLVFPLLSSSSHGAAVFHGCLPPDDDKKADLHVVIFPSDVTVHGSTAWTSGHPAVKKAWSCVPDRQAAGDTAPSRISLTIPIVFHTEEPQALWRHIQGQLGLTVPKPPPLSAFLEAVTGCFEKVSDLIESI